MFVAASYVTDVGVIAAPPPAGVTVRSPAASDAPTFSENLTLIDEIQRSGFLDQVYKQ